MSRTVIETRTCRVRFSRRLFRENIDGMEALVTLEVQGEQAQPEAGWLVPPDVFDATVRARLLDVFSGMCVVHWADGFIETLFDKDTYHNRGWEEHLDLIRERIAGQGYFTTRQMTTSPYRADVLFVAVAEPPTGSNLAYLFHRLLAPDLYRLGVRRMRVVVGESSETSAIYVGDVRETPDYPSPKQPAARG